MACAAAGLSCAAADPAGEGATKPGALLGRWALTAVYHSNRDDKADHMMLDLVPCGTRFCGVKVAVDGTCQQKILKYKDNAADHGGSDGNELSDRYTGLLEWNDEVAKYYVTIDLYDLEPSTAGTNAKLQLGMNGYPAADGVPSVYDSRSYPLTVEFRYVGPAKCSVPTS